MTGAGPDARSVETRAMTHMYEILATYGWYWTAFVAVALPALLWADRRRRRARATTEAPTTTTPPEVSHGR